MRTRYGVLALLVAVFAALGVVACGGDDDAPIVPVEEQTAPPDQLSQDEFIDEADAICEEGNIAIANLADTSAGDPTTALAEERELVGGMLDQLSALGAPSEDESTLDDFIDAVEELADNLDKQQLAAERDDATSLAELETEETTIRTEVATAAQDYGFKECGQESEATVDASTDTGVGAGTGTDTGVAPVEPAPVEPAPVEPAPVEPVPPSEAAPVEPAPTPAPAPPSGGTGGTGGGGGSGGVSP
jgi:hypothetical protein